MEFSELLTARYSVRAYKPDPIPEETLQQVLEAARLAPTAANRQPFRVILIHTRGREQELQRVYHHSWFTQAPLIVCVCAVPEEAWVREDRRSYCDVDAAIALDHLILAAANLGLGTCWIAHFDVQAAREILQVPQSVEPLLFTPLGYPADHIRPKKRRPLADLVRFEKW
jgi:nitroreductase